jgi:translation initiation factor eIF-2B subunit delta
MPAGAPEPTPVVTAFLYRRGKLLVLRRSDRVATHRGKWCGVSGYLERPPLAQARREMREEVGIGPARAALRSIGLPFLVADPETDRTWLVFTFLFSLADRARVRLDWESVESAWVKPDELADLNTVPGLAAGLTRVWPPWGPPSFWREMEAVASDTVTGATDLALRALRAVQRLRRGDRRRGLLASAALHPSVGIFPHLAARGLTRGISAAALARRLDAASARSASAAARALRPCQRVLTHSASKTCLEALVKWGEGGREVIATESRPQREGVQLARELSAAGLRVTLISDAQIGLFVPRCEALLLGADAVTDDDHLVNKVGSRLAVLAAREAGVPAYAVAQTFKICPPGWPVVLTPQDPDDLARLPGARVANIAFDATPLSWFTDVFTERGPLSADLLDGVRRSLAGELPRHLGAI